MKVSDFIIEFFEKKGITDSFTVSGGGCMHLIDSLSRSKMKTTCFHHEQSMLMASDGYYRANSKPSLNIVTSGPGGTNTITGLTGLWLDSLPSIIISGQVPTNQLSLGTGCRQIGDQELDIIEIVKPITKYAERVNSVLELESKLEDAYTKAISGRPGPSWLDIPLNIQSSIIQTEDEVFDSIINELTKSKKPIVVVGNGIRISKSYKKLSAFLLKNNLPVITGPHSGVDSVDNTYKYYLGRFGVLGQITSNKLIQESDLLLVLGSRLTVKMTGYNTLNFAPNAKKIIIDIDPSEIAKHKFDISIALKFDLLRFFDKINKYDLKMDTEKWLNHITEVRGQQFYLYPKHINNKNYISFYYFIDRLSFLNKDLPIITSNGSAHVITLQSYQLNKNQRLFTNVGCASMGYGLPASIGAALAFNNSVICIEGDGSIMMNLQELQTISTNQIPIKIILINNDGYLSIKQTQSSFFKNEFASGPKSGVGFPDFKTLAKGFNIPYYKIAKNREVDKGIKWLLKENLFAILEVFSDPNEKHEPRVITNKGIDSKGNIISGNLDEMYISDE